MDRMHNSGSQRRRQEWEGLRQFRVHRIYPGEFLAILQTAVSSVSFYFKQKFNWYMYIQYCILIYNVLFISYLMLSRRVSIMKFSFYIV